MSATMKAAKFSVYFNDAPVISVSGWPTNVTIHHKDTNAADYRVEMVKMVCRLLHQTPGGSGDILAFLLGERDIHGVFRAITNDAETRQVILTTNIASTSLTIPSGRGYRIYPEVQTTHSKSEMNIRKTISWVYCDDGRWNRLSPRG